MVKDPFGNMFKPMSDQMKSLTSLATGLNNLEHVLPTYQAQVNAMVGEIFQTNQQVQAAVLTLSNSFKISHGSIFENISDIGKSFNDLLPSISDAARNFDTLIERARTDRVLDRGGYGFIAVALERDLYAGVQNYDSRIQAAMLTKRLRDETRSRRFAADLKHLFLESDLLRRRWPVLADALVVCQG